MEPKEKPHQIQATRVQQQLVIMYSGSSIC